jgi:hypothetical protein
MRDLKNHKDYRSLVIPSPRRSQGAEGAAKDSRCVNERSCKFYDIVLQRVEGEDYVEEIF